MLRICESAGQLLVWGLKSFSQRGLNHLSGGWLVLSIYRRGTGAAGCTGSPMQWRAWAPARRNTNGDADSCCFAQLSRHRSPCGRRWWWQMDCHLWMRGDWDMSPHISLSGLQTLPVFCLARYMSFNLSFLFLLMSRLRTRSSCCLSSLKARLFFYQPLCKNKVFCCGLLIY